MQTLDWIVLAGTIAGIVLYGTWLSRRERGMQNYMLAGHRMPWWMVMVSVMATQASAITFLSTPGRGYAEGLRFVQFYFGLPLAMIVLSVTAVPIFHKLNVYTAYEYLEKRFDKKTRTLATVLFLVMRGLSTGLTVYTPALMLSILLHWNISITSALMGGLAILYTAWGGSAAVGKTQFIQFMIILFGMGAAAAATISLLPAGSGFGDAIALAGATGKTRALDTNFSWTDDFTLWSGLIGGCFLQMSYFGADQSQVGRYLGGRSITESRLGLLFNGLLKIPMQFAILTIGLLVFAAYHFLPQPIYFNSVEWERMHSGSGAARVAELETEHRAATAERRAVAEAFLQLRHADAPAAELDRAAGALALSQEKCDAVRERASRLVSPPADGVYKKADDKDNDYVFLRFVLDQLPAGLIGLVVAGIFCAAMSACAAQFNALGASSALDIYKNIFAPAAGDDACVRASRIATVIWGAFAIGFAQFAGRLGSLIKAVNVLGSIFYGTMLGMFLVAFYMKRARGTAVFCAALASESIVILLKSFSDISFLWYNVVGVAATATLAFVFSFIFKERK
ncbi:MAG: sodium:solute symporter [Planctomycetes bacterium]|nr:sodium:solute symporter [Planctomycetota bacterium]